MREVLTAAETIAKIVSLIAIPVVLAVGGWFIQKSLSDQSLKKDYVTIAVSILQKPDKDVPAGLREWAADLLNDNSPTKFSADTLAQLKSGAISLGAVAAILRSQGGALAINPSSTQFSVGGDDGSISVYDLATGARVSSLRGHSDAVTSLAYSPDGRQLLSGSFDKTVGIWDLTTSRLVRKLIGHSDAVIGVAVASDGRTVLTRSLDSTVRYWNLQDGKVLRELNIQ
jgi:WD40 repeat protein